MKTMNFEFRYIAGQSFARIGKQLRAPLHVLHRVLGADAVVTSHRISGNCKQRCWFSAECRTQREALQVWQRLLALYPAAKNDRQFAIAASGGRLA
jgi:hypothetical protein